TEEPTRRERSGQDLLTCYLLGGPAHPRLRHGPFRRSMRRGATTIFAVGIAIPPSGTIPKYVVGQECEE
ncbi:MAG: hypothetical protein ACREJ6_14890, partial [Candidatus Methylomirabilis sp.]